MAFTLAVTSTLRALGENSAVIIGDYKVEPDAIEKQSGVLKRGPGAGDDSKTIPERHIPEPAPRGETHKVPATNWEQRPVLWGWTCELSDGSGLCFGGIHQTADDGNPHTSILDGGVWKSITGELRKTNPRQKHFGQARNLRDACKDTLARARHIRSEERRVGKECCR